MYSIFIGVIIVELYRIDIRIQSAYGGQQTHNEISVNDRIRNVRKYCSLHTFHTTRETRCR